MKNRVILSTVLSGLFISSLAIFLGGCGSSSSSLVDVNTSSKSKNIDDINKLRDKLQKRSVNYQSGIYSKDKKEIIILGIDNGVYTVYKFDAKSLELQDSYPIKIDGVVSFKNVNDDGTFTISSKDNNEVNDYIFNIDDKKLEKKSEYKVEAPEEIIQKRLSSNEKLVEYKVTPTGLGFLAIIQDGNEMRIALYGLEDPKNPLFEYDLEKNADSLYDISILKSGVVNYHKVDNTIKTLVTYDYFYKKVLDRKSENSNSDSLIESLISKDIKSKKNGYVRLFMNTPTKLGAIVLRSHFMGDNFLDLYGLEDPQNPQFEKTLDSSYSIINPKITKDGEITYMKMDKRYNYTLVSYDYYNKKELNHKSISEQDKIAMIKENIERYFNNEANSELGMKNAKVDFIKNCTEDNYITKLSYGDGKKGRLLDFRVAKQDYITYYKWDEDKNIAPPKDIDCIENSKSIHYTHKRNYYKDSDKAYKKIYKSLDVIEEANVMYTTTIWPDLLDDVSDYDGSDGNPFVFHINGKILTTHADCRGNVDLYSGDGKYIKTLYLSENEKVAFKDFKIQNDNELSFQDGNDTITIKVNEAKALKNGDKIGYMYGYRSSYNVWLMTRHDYKNLPRKCSPLY